MSNSVFDALYAHAAQAFQLTDSADDVLDAQHLKQRVTKVAELLTRSASRGVALYADNGLDWIVTDLACQMAGVRIVPLPLFFSDQQLRFALHSGGIDTLITDQPARLLPMLRELGVVETRIAAGRVCMYTVQSSLPALVPDATAKITYTSGTTGNPKGVCLSLAHQLTVARSLVKAVGLERPRHLCLLPLSTLLENVAGVYAPLLAGGEVIVPSLAEIGFTGSSGLNIRRLLESISLHRPDSIILVPEMLNALTLATDAGWTPPASLKFVAVGGGKTAASLIEKALAAGLPVHEGYGLSECGSVVSLNRPGHARPGTVGQPLEHLGVHIDDGEIVVDGLAFLGYAGQPDTWKQGRVRTGDLGHFDADGYLTIDGRRKALMISSYGRNISPEWIESELVAGAVLQQAVVFGDARPYCVALVSPRQPQASDQQIDAWIHAVNAQLPDYARIAVWHRLGEPLSNANGLMTENGRPRRPDIAQQFGTTLEQLFNQPPEAVAI